MRRQVRLLRTCRFRPDSAELVAGRVTSRGSRLALSEAPLLRGEVKAGLGKAHLLRRRWFSYHSGLGEGCEVDHTLPEGRGVGFGTQGKGWIMPGVGRLSCAACAPGEPMRASRRTARSGKRRGVVRNILLLPRVDMVQRETVPGLSDLLDCIEVKHLKLVDGGLQVRVPRQAIQQFLSILHGSQLGRP